MQHKNTDSNSSNDVKYIVNADKTRTQRTPENLHSTEAKIKVADRGQNPHFIIHPKGLLMSFPNGLP